MGALLKMILATITTGLLCACFVFADGWGRKVEVTSTSTVTTVSSTLPVKRMTFYNAGTADVAVLFNVTAAQLTTAITSAAPTAIYIRPSTTLEYNQMSGPGSTQLGAITSFAVWADIGSTTMTLYSAAN